VIEAHAKAQEGKQKAKADQVVHTPLTMVAVTKILAQQWRDVSTTRPVITHEAFTCRGMPDPDCPTCVSGKQRGEEAIS
jgi:hypothetical protein